MDLRGSVDLLGLLEKVIYSDGQAPMLRRLIVIAVTLLSGFAGGQAAAQAQESIGAVSRIQGEASGTRGGATRASGLNAPVFPNQAGSPGETARLGGTFPDNPRVTPGGT